MRKCSKGFPCGKTCISKTRLCWKNLSTENSKVAETFSQFVNRLVGIEATTEGNNNNPIEKIGKTWENPNPIKNPVRLAYPPEIGGLKYKKDPGFYKEFREFVEYEVNDMGIDLPKERLSKERIALSYYMTSGYLEVNPWLRDGGGGLNSFESEAIGWIVDELNSLPPLEEDVILYRGAELDESFKEGDVYVAKGFFSTSENPDVAEGFSGHNNSKIFIVKAKKNGKGKKLPYSDIEREVLFNHNSPFRIKKVESIGDKEYITLEEI